MLSILRLFLSLFLMLLHSNCRNPWNSFCLLRRMEATTLLHFFPASLHHRVLTNPDGKKCFCKLMTSEENREEAIISPYFFIWWHIPRTQVKFSHQFLNRYWVGNAKVQLMFPGYWVLRSEILASTSFRQPQVQEWCSQEASLFGFWLKNKTKWNRNKPSLFLDYTIQEKDHSHWTFSFPFLSLQSLHKYK